MKKDLILSVITGISFALAMPPFKTGFLAYGTLIPFFILLRNKSIFNAILWGYVTGFFIYLFCLFWIGFVTVPGVIGALIVLPLFSAAFALLQSLLLKAWGELAIFFTPFLWTGVEYLQSLGDTAFPWVYLGYTQTYYLPVIQMAELTSVYGITFWIVTLNALIYYCFFREKSNTPALVLLFALFLLPFIYGFFVLQEAESKRAIRIGMVQGNIDPFEKWSSENDERFFAKYDSLSRLALDSEPDLMIWPETATPFYLRYEVQYLERIHSWVDSSSVPLLTGSIDYEYTEKGYQYYNSALLINPGEVDISHYAKQKLVPFSEKVPYHRYFPFRYLKDFLYDMQLGIGDYARGEEHAIFSVFPASRRQKKGATPVEFACAICYESVFPDYIRRFVERGIDFLVVITNDAWFGKTTAPYQHARIAVLRAVENRIPIARCANTGITCFIDSFGRMYNTTDIFTTKIVVNQLPLTSTGTFYTRHGNWFARLCISVMGLALVSLVPAVIYKSASRSSKGTLNHD